MTTLRCLWASLLALPLAACGAGTIVPPSAQVAPPGPPASAFMKQGPLLGADARQLTQMFGQPRLDIRETTVRKLQYANGRCVLDAYLYAPARGKEPVVTHVDARSPSGTDLDPAACASALQAK
ncbi:hypothetical protein Q4610_11675 [Sphingobium sp. HBC34]|uniref:Lipoprotein SmpA/OmlA domain-containing protein n=1 Tax=Sphingobium cyanobacteriorum TaxID=3063954 RepID=A0ABT8ZNB5_9SPHN|nr:hypothetical protein [Sphingobium sp. HBC34]MDO7835701.1 hypothetical protein [Sphingobium sp. HBC34]